MDIGLIRKLVKVPDGTKDKQLQFMLTSGMNCSALEHSVPEQIFSSPDTPAQGISAVKALKIANEQGIPIFTISQTNINAVLPQLSVDEQVKADIRNAVNAGKIVTVSKTNITFNGWTGCGYIIIDPNTGAGGYMISGGMNGGAINSEKINLLVALAGVLSIYSLIAMGVFFVAGLPLLALVAAVATGLLIGFMGSQILSQEFKGYLNYLVTDTDFIIATLTVLAFTGASLALWFVVAAVLIINVALQQQVFIYKRPSYLLMEEIFT